MRDETDSLTMRMGVRSRDSGAERLAVEYPNFWTHEKNQPRIGAITKLRFALRLRSLPLA